MVSIINTRGVFRFQWKSSILDVRMSSEYAYEFTTLMEKFCRDFRASEDVILSLWSSHEVKQLTDWIHSTILLEAQ